MRSRPDARLRPAAVAALTVPALVLSGCGGADTESEPTKATTSPSASPSGDADVPEGVTLTEPGAELEFGEEATVAYEANPRRKSVLSLAVTSVREGRISDFRDYDLPPAVKRSRPYYVRVAVENVGDGDLGRVPVPLLAEDDRNVLIQPSSFSNTFKRCPSEPLPEKFTAEKAMKGCLVYLIPDGGTLVGVTYRPLQAVDGITWEGRIAPPEEAGKKKAQKGSKGKKKKGKP